MIKITSGSTGSFLTPPNHPTQFFSVVSSGPDGDGSMSLEYAVSDDAAWMNGRPESKAVRLDAAARLAQWAANKPAIDSQPVQDWIKAVFAHLAHCWRFDGQTEKGWIVGKAAVHGWHDIDIFSQYEKTITKTQLNFAGLANFVLGHYAPVLYIRGYYPEYAPEFSPAEYAEILNYDDKARFISLYAGWMETAKLCTMENFLAADDDTAAGQDASQ